MEKLSTSEKNRLKREINRASEVLEYLMVLGKQLEKSTDLHIQCRQADKGHKSIWSVYKNMKRGSKVLKTGSFAACMDYVLEKWMQIEIEKRIAA